MPKKAPTLKTSVKKPSKPQRAKCFRCKKITTHSGNLCSYCLIPIKHLLKNMDDPFSKLAYDLIWSVRKSARKSLVKSVADEHLPSYKQLKNENNLLKSVNKCFREQFRVQNLWKNTNSRLGFKDKSNPKKRVITFNRKYTLALKKLQVQ